MSIELTPIDITHLTTNDLLALVEEVNTTKKPRLLMRDSEMLAMLLPAGPRLPQKTKGIWTHYDPTHVRAALKESAGTLAGVDRDDLVDDIAKQRSQESLGRPF